MSLNRLIFYSAVIGGWSAFAGWLVCELLFIGLLGLNPFTIWTDLLMACCVGASIGGGLMTLAAAATGKWSEAPRRLGYGLVGGLSAGLAGGLIAGVLYAAVGGFFLRIVGWVLLGLAIGAVDGVYERSARRLRNGLLGGAIGGFFGGLLLQPLATLLASSTGMSGRCFGFVLLGACIGLLISLVQVVLKSAWLIVEEGYRPGRELALTEVQTTLGTSEKVSLPFIAFGAKGVEPVHVVLHRQPNASYTLQDNRTRTGTRLNGQPLQEAALLRDGDVIQFGVNAVRFRERRRAAGAVTDGERTARPVPAVAAAQAIRAALPPVTVVLQPAAALPPGAAPPRPAVPVASAAPPSSSAGKAAEAQVLGNCPNCGARTAGTPGKRVCKVCQQVF